MLVHKGIKIVKEGQFLITIGLQPIINRELNVRINQKDLEDYIMILKYVINYILQSNAIIQPGQTIGYFSWVLKFVDEPNKIYSLWEAANDGNSYNEGSDYSIQVVKEQIAQCEKYGEAPIFPTFSQNIVISNGIYEGLPFQAVRYKSPSHMTGWWLTTDLYDGNVNSLMNVHYYHVAFERPKILKYLALPYGFRFFFSGASCKVWFDKDALE